MNAFNVIQAPSILEIARLKLRVRIQFPVFEYHNDYICYGYSDHQDERYEIEYSVDHENQIYSSYYPPEKLAKLHYY